MIRKALGISLIATAGMLVGLFDASRWPIPEFGQFLWPIPVAALLLTAGIVLSTRNLP